MGNLVKKSNENGGLNITRQIWSDIQNFKGYISYNILVDQDTKEHLLVLANGKAVNWLIELKMNMPMLKRGD